MKGWELIEQLTEALRAEDRGRGSVDETALAIEGIAERLAALEGKPARAVRLIGPAIESGHTRDWIVDQVGALIEDEGLDVVCPWPGCSSSDFQQAWRLWSVARSTGISVEGAAPIADIDHAGDEVIWDSVHDEHLECRRCCRAVSVNEIREH